MLEPREFLDWAGGGGGLGYLRDETKTAARETA